MNGLDDKTLMALMGHKYAKSLQVYTKVFALDVLSAVPCDLRRARRRGGSCGLFNAVKARAHCH
ncbi:hypothetical protein [Rouxiella badensis]|uniref:hypothetical protein n=1 Tax=Rouxiella badensis TaxID=1646377 RepID=UPI003C6DCF7B